MDNTIKLNNGRTVTVVCTADSMCVRVTDADGTDRALTLYDDEKSIASLDADGIEVHVYKSTIDGKIVTDILTATPSVVEHDANDVPLIRVCINDEDVWDGGAPTTLEPISIVPKMPPLRTHPV
jgi:hypothetical protein